MGEQCEHGAPSSGCIDCLLEGRHAYAYAQGRADERAAIVAWLRDDGAFMSMLFATLRAHDRDLLALAIERGEHEVKKP